MPKRIPARELDLIVSLVKPHPNGVRIDDIRGRLALDYSERALQRRLSRLASEGRIVARGSTRGKRYFPAEKPFADGTALPTANKAARPTGRKKKIMAPVVRHVSERGVKHIFGIYSHNCLGYRNLTIQSNSIFPKVRLFRMFIQS